MLSPLPLFLTVGIIFITNKVVSILDFQTIKNNVKSTNHINTNDVETPRLSQSKSYLKIIGISYPQENSTSSITLNVVEDIIKKNHIFDNVILTLKPWIIKVSSKSDMAIIWVNIWDIQSGSKAKSLINRCFNIESYITTIRGTNMNSDILQYKNYWK